MGEEKALICRDCELHCYLNKSVISTAYKKESFEDWMEYDLSWKMVRKILAFLNEHRGHEVSFVGEYGRYQDVFFTSSLQWDHFKDWER